MDDFTGEFTAVAGESRIDTDSRVEVTFHRKVRDGIIALVISHEPGTVVTIGEKIIVENFGFISSP